MRPYLEGNVALLGRRGAGRGPFLVFTLSARGRVQISLAHAHVVRGATADALHLALSARKGQNRCLLISLLHGQRLPHGRYVLTVRAGNRSATVQLTV